MMVYLIGPLVLVLIVVGWLWYEAKNAPILESNDDQ